MYHPSATVVNRSVVVALAVSIIITVAIVAIVILTTCYEARYEVPAGVVRGNVKAIKKEFISLLNCMSGISCMFPGL